MGDNPGPLQFCEEEIEHVAQARSRIAHPMRHVQPAFFGLDRRGALAVFDLLDSVISAAVDNDFLIDHCFFNAGRKTPADAAALARLNKTILRPGIEGVLAGDELGMQHHVALLR